MNLAESIKLVFKNKNSPISLFLKEDLIGVVKDFKLSWIEIFSDSKIFLQKAKQNGAKLTLIELAQSFKSLFVVLAFLPKRIVVGLNFFKEDFLEEIENCHDSKEKTLLALKVLGAFTQFSIIAFYEIKKGNSKIKIKGLGQLNQITNLIIAELVFKITTSFLLRLFDSIEPDLSPEDGRKQFGYFRQIISNKEIDQNTDNSVIIVEKFKKYIMTGER